MGVVWAVPSEDRVSVSSCFKRFVTVAWWARSHEPRNRMRTRRTVPHKIDKQSRWDTVCTISRGPRCVLFLLRA